MTNRDRNERFLLVGTYTKERPTGLYLYGYEPEQGTTELYDTCVIANASYVIRGPGDMLYCASENEGPSYVSRVRFDRTERKLTAMEHLRTASPGTCYLNGAVRGKLVTADYGGGTVSVFDTEGDGTLVAMSQRLSYTGRGPNPDRQEAPHIHCTVCSPDGRYLFVTDLGTDTIYRYDIDPPGRKLLDERSRRDFSLEPGSGPRHIIFNADGTRAYLINELSGTIQVYAYNNGELTLMQSVQSNQDSPQGAAHIAFGNDERLLLASSRDGNDGIAVYDVLHNGTLERRGFTHTGNHPRFFVVDGRRVLSANKDSGSIEFFDTQDNGSTYHKFREDLSIPEPVCMLIL